MWNRHRHQGKLNRIAALRGTQSQEVLDLIEAVILDAGMQGTGYERRALAALDSLTPKYTLDDDYTIHASAAENGA